MATRKWTKQQRAEASEKAKIAHARRKRDVRISDVNEQPGVLSGGSANASALGFSFGPQAMAIDVVKLIAHDVPADVIVKVVERILR